MEFPLVSIIVPMYNAAGCIARCVKSICAQSYKSIEIILLNDGSKDGTLSVCRALAAQDHRIALVDKPNSGAADTRNQGLALAHGRYVQFVDSDDWLAPDFTEKLVTAAETHAAEQLLELDLTALRSRYLHSMICTTPQELMILWDDLYKAMQTAALGAVRLRTLAVLHWLYTHKTLPQNSSQYLTRTQSLLAKRLEEELTRDLSRRVAVHTVAAALGVGETSLKNYFRSVYGVNVSTYQNNARMKLAARLLAHTDQSIANIARQCGYVNQGRFAGVFYEKYHVKPLDYRRRTRLQTNET